MALAQGQRIEQLEQQLGELQSSLQSVASVGQRNEEKMNSLERFWMESMATLTGNQCRLEEEIKKSRPEQESNPRGTPPIPGNPTSQSESMAMGHFQENVQGRGGHGGRWEEREGGTVGRFCKLELPIFEGTNPDGWILRMERYFGFYRLSASEKMEATVVALEGDALLWYQFAHRQRPILNWEELKALILRRFRPTYNGTLHEQWLSHRQDGDFQMYVRGFIELMAPLEWLRVSLYKAWKKRSSWKSGLLGLERWRRQWS